MAGAISQTFKQLRQRGKKAFIPFITAGDPDLETTIRLVAELERAGSDVVELGIPFSDPVADGPTIQRSSERALGHGYRLADYLEAVKAIRCRSSIPLVLFSYLNPLLRYGLDKLARDARAAGADGVLVTDMTPEESQEYCASLESHGLDAIFLVAPTSSAERICRIVECCRGFVYVVSRTGVTGVSESLSSTVLPTLELVRKHTSLPVAVGFGISHPEHVQAVWKVADGAVVGSAIVAQIERNAGAADLPSRIGAFCRWLVGGGEGQA
jgi:tryptophan synthase alpha chain